MAGTGAKAAFVGWGWGYLRWLGLGLHSLAGAALAGTGAAFVGCGWCCGCVGWHWDWGCVRWLVLGLRRPALGLGCVGWHRDWGCVDGQRG